MAIPACGRPALAAVIGWALAHHELHTRHGPASSLRRFVVRSEEQELSVSPSGCPTYLSLRRQRKVGQRKATPRPRPLRILAQRVRVSRSGFSDRPSLACRKPWPHPCGQPCGRIDRLPPLPRGPGEERGLLPAEAEAEAKARAKPRARTNPKTKTKSPLQQRNAGARSCFRSPCCSPCCSCCCSCCCCCCCSGSCGQEPALFHGAPGERRECVDQPAGSPAGMPAMFVTGQGRPVHEHPRTHANPSRTDARRARTRGGLSLAYFSLATQREVGRAGRRTDRKLLLFAPSDEATQSP